MAKLYAVGMIAATVCFAGDAVLAAEQIVAQAAPITTALLSIGFVEAKLSDFVGTAAYSKRLADPTGFLVVSADFRGDGRLDQARLLRNLDRGIAYVVIVTVREKIDTYVVKTMPLQEADNVGLRKAAPRNAAHTASGLTIFALDETGSETFDLNDDDFTQRTQP